MKIHEIMLATGLTKRTIHHYIRKGLLQPETERNGYYNFSEEDLGKLKLIQQLRALDLPVKDIYEILQSPEASLFLLANHKRKLHRKKALLNWQYEKISELENQMAFNPSISQFADFRPIPDSSFLFAEDTTPIDEIDAEIIAFHFWGNHMRDLDLTEYRKFLYNRIQQHIITYQNERMIAFRNYLCSLTPNEITGEYFFTKRNFYNEISSLGPDEYPSYTARMIAEIEKHLRNPVWVSTWKSYYKKYIYPATSYYDDSIISELFCELSPQYKVYQANTRKCCEYIFEYLESDAGAPLKHKLLTKLNGYIDIESDHHAILMGLYTFEPHKTIT